MSMGKIKKVNLGSGKDYIQGWVNVDNDREVKADIYADLSGNFPFPTNSITEIKASDILEHFTKEEGTKFLYECWRVLKPRGKIIIRTHNIFQIFKQFSNDPDVLTHFLYGDTSETGIYGAHKYGYTKNSLTKVLKKVGYEIISFDKETTNFLVVARKINVTKIPLKIAIIQDTPDIGGAEIYMHSLVTNFVADRNKVYIATGLDKYFNMYDASNVELEKLPSFVIDIIGDWKGLIKTILYLPYSVFYFTKLLQKYRKEKVDVILMSGFSEKLLVTFISIFIKIPVVWIEYGKLESIFKRNFYLSKIIYRLLKNVPEAIIVPSNNTLSSLIIDARVSLAKLHLVQCGTIVRPLKGTKDNSKKKYNNKIVIGNISRLTREKGQQFIIKAAPIVLRHIKNASFVLVGDGPDKKFYEKLIKKNRLEEKFLITGFANNKNEYLSKMDIFVFPTTWRLEGFGIVAIEAMERGIPVIASNIGPVPEIVDDDITGILFKPGDSRELAKQIVTLSKNKKMRSWLGGNGRKKVVKQYNIERASKRILEILRDSTYNR